MVSPTIKLLNLEVLASLTNIGLTPLEKAKIPNMDKIAKSGLTGIHDPVQTNLA